MIHFYPLFLFKIAIEHFHNFFPVRAGNLKKVNLWGKCSADDKKN